MNNSATFIMRDQVDNQITNIMAHYKTANVIKPVSQFLMLVISITVIGVI